MKTLSKVAMAFATLNILAACHGVVAFDGEETASDPAAESGPVTGQSLATSSQSPRSGFASHDTIEICDSAGSPPSVKSFVITHVGPAESPQSALTYRCTSTCANGLCTTESGGLHLLSFVTADGMAGYLRFNRPARHVDTVFFHKGSSGTEWPSAKWGVLAERMRAASIMVVEARWETGYGIPETPAGFGWFTRPSESSISFFELTKRPARVMQWVHDNLAGSGKYASVACSAGAVGTSFARIFHGQRTRMDYQLFAGGPWNWNAEQGCFGTTGLKWGTASGAIGIKALIDYDHQTGGQCLSGKQSGDWDADDSGANVHALGGDWYVGTDSSVDFVLNVNGTMRDDRSTGYEAHADRFRAAMRGESKFKQKSIAYGEHCEPKATQKWCELIKSKGWGLNLDCSGTFE